MIRRVSIPIGFSHQLRRTSHQTLPKATTRFNPYRVFSSAETVRGDHRDRGGRRVSIPIGFSHQLRQAVPASFTPIASVSIPIGFSHQLRPPGLSSGRGDGAGFNPYRVFSSAETGSPSLPAGVSGSFNPYRVFSSAETPARLAEIFPAPQFQSLSGFLIS